MPVRRPPGPPPASPSSTARRARGAVAALFFANGALFANVVPRFPELKAGLELSNTAFGTAVAAYGVAALALGLLAGVVVSRWGSATVAVVTTLGLAASLVALGTVPSWVTLAAAFFVAGAFDSVADIAVNAHGLRVERLYGRSILNAFHGLWSVGAVIGGAMGTAAAGLGVPVAWHLSVAAAMFAGLAIAVACSLLPGGDDAERAAVAPVSLGWRPSARAGIVSSVALLGVIAALTQTVEDSSATWGVVYLHDDLGATAAVSGLGFIALQALQTVGRLVGDRAVTRYGDRAVARVGAALAAIAMTVALAAPSAAMTVVAFGAVGLGIGTLLPATMRAADEIPGLPSGVGMTLVGSILRVSLFVVPPVIGLLADAFTLRAALLTIPAAAAVVVVLARALPDRPTRPSGTD